MNPPDFRKIFGNVLDWIYPPVCVHCGKPGALICDECLAQLPEVGEHFCSICGKPLKPGHYCRLCGISDFRFHASRAPYLYEGPVSAMIKHLKYDGMLDLAPTLARLLTEFWQDLHWNVDFVVPVPLAAKRKAQRGFNQSELIAKAFAKNTSLKCDPRALVKCRDTLQQVGLKAEERHQNLHGAFAAEPVLVQGKRILLLDDVMTTGSTFAECSAVLLDAGASSVSCLSVATTLIDRGKQKLPDALQRI